MAQFMGMTVLGVKRTIAGIDPAALHLHELYAPFLRTDRRRTGPIRHRHNGREHLHDRASYRYFWQVIERAHRTSIGGHAQLPAEVRVRYFGR